MSNFGFAAINDSSKIGLGGNSQVLESLKNSKLLATGRVLSVVMDETHPRYKELGGPKAIGAVEIIDVAGSTGDYSTTSQNQNYTVAYPLYPGVKNYPLVNEVVYLVSQPNKQTQRKTTAFSLYYVSVVNLWNHPHHNAIPYSAGSSIPQNSKNYQDTAAGSSNKLTTSSGTIKFGQYFKERTDINPLKPFEGDHILEGRFGNSIRLGSTGGTSPWSTTGEQGSPIMILRNGQGTLVDNPWTLLPEDINVDASSIYLTAGQKIPFLPASINYFSYKQNPPVDPNQFTGNQIILTSGRLLLNASTDHLLLSSAKSISLSSNSSVNIDAQALVIQSENIYLGSNSAKEPLLLGDTTAALLDDLISIIGKLLEASLQASNGGGPVPSLNKAGADLLIRLQKLQTNQIKSKYNYTV